MKKQHYVRGSGIPATHTNNRSHSTTACHNLRSVRLQTGATALTPVGTPVRLSEEALTPLTTMTCGDRRLIVASSAGRLQIIDPAPAEAGISLMADDRGFALPGEALCATTDGDRLTVMTDRHQLRLTLDGESGELYETGYDGLPAVVLTAETLADVSATIGPRKLSTDYPAGNHSLADRDLRAISSDMRHAYCAICRQAAADGVFIAPRLCRWRIIGRDGDILTESSPLLLGAADGSRLTAPLTFSSDDRRTIEQQELSLPSWRPVITVTGNIPDAIGRLIDRIEVIAAPPFHGFDADETAAVTLIATPGCSDFARVTMPGAWKSVSPGNSRQGKSRLSRMIATGFTSADIIAVMRPTENTALISVPADSVVAQCLRTEKALAQDIPAPDILLHRISPPHSFTAGCVTSVAGTELWGRLRAHRFGGYKAENFAASRGEAGAWHAAAEVSFADGERLVTVSEGTSGAPLTFNPVLSYPSPDATAITVTVSTAGEVRRATFTLTPDPSGTMAVHIHPGLAPHALVGSAPAFVIPDERRTDRVLDNYICVCAVPNAGAPRRPLAIASVSDGRVYSVLPGSRLTAGWATTAPHFTVFSASGTHRATLSGDALRLTLIDSTPANGDHAAVIAGGRLIAATGSRLIEVGAGTVRTLADNIRADAIACGAGDELWLASEEAVSVLDLATMTHHTRSESGLGASSGHYALLGAQLCDLSRETAASSLYVRWAGAVSLGDAYRRIRQMRLDLRASSVSSGTLTLRRLSHDTAENGALCRLNINGSLRSPLILRTRSLPARGCAFDFQARVSSDTIVSSVIITSE